MQKKKKKKKTQSKPKNNHKGHILKLDLLQKQIESKSNIQKKKNKQTKA